MNTPRRVLVADDERLMRTLLVQALGEHGIHADAQPDGRAALDAIRADPPDVLLLDLLMPRLDGFQVLAALAQEDRLSGMQVIVLTGRASAEVLTQALEAGADDYIAKPFHVDEVVARVKAHLRIVGYARQLEQRQRDGEILVEIGQRLSSQLDLLSILQEVTTLVAGVLDSDRCSIVLFDQDGPHQARVVAASDAAGLTNRRIDLRRYPELSHVAQTRAPLVVGDVTLDPLLDGVKAQLADVDVRCVALFPLLEAGRCFGVLFLRSHEPRDTLTDREMQIGRIVATSTAVALTNARLFAAVKADAERQSHAAALVTQRLQTMQRYADFFENAADALCVVRPSGRLIYMNRRATALTGQSVSAAGGQPLAEVCGVVDRAAFDHLFERFRAGELSETHDVAVRGGRLWSLSAGHIPNDDALSVTVRDVTDQRRNAKLAAVAELAGAAAHELNQPLTSVLGYAQLIARKAPQDPLILKAAHTIEAQAERMAALVKRIGRITRYETTDYVGGTRILDLEAAAADPDGDGEP